MWDKPRALELLFKHLGLLIDRGTRRDAVTADRASGALPCVTRAIRCLGYAE